MHRSIITQKTRQHQTASLAAASFWCCLPASWVPGDSCLQQARGGFSRPPNMYRKAHGHGQKKAYMTLYERLTVLINTFALALKASA